MIKKDTRRRIWSPHVCVHTREHTYTCIYTTDSHTKRRKNLGWKYLYSKGLVTVNMQQLLDIKAPGPLFSVWKAECLLEILGKEQLPGQRWRRKLSFFSLLLSSPDRVQALPPTLWWCLSVDFLDQPIGLIAMPCPKGKRAVEENGENQGRRGFPLCLAQTWLSDLGD